MAGCTVRSAGESFEPILRIHLFNRGDRHPDEIEPCFFIAAIEPGNRFERAGVFDPASRSSSTQVVERVFVENVAVAPFNVPAATTFHSARTGASAAPSGPTNRLPT
jgi:hypothetical protein